MFGTILNLALLYWKRHSYRTSSSRLHNRADNQYFFIAVNFVLLTTFTLMESVTLGVVVAYFDQIIVLQAL